MINKIIDRLKKHRTEQANLPVDFDADTYLELNPDVKKAGADPGQHFLNYGIREGRNYKSSNPEVLD
jgi:hypothetical protein